MGQAIGQLWFVDEPKRPVFFAAYGIEHGRLPVVLAGVVVGDDDLLIFASGFLRHAVGAGGVKDVELFVECQNKGTVVIRHHHKAIAFQKCVMETLVVSFCESHRVTSLRLKVGRVAVKERAHPVVLPDQVHAVLVFNDHIGQTAGTCPDQIEKPAQVAGLSGERFCAAAETVADELKIIRRTTNVAPGRTLHQHTADHLHFRHWQIDFRQFQLFFQIVIGEALLGEEPVQHVEVIPGIQGQKSQLADQGHGTVFDAEKEIGQVTVVVVIDFHAVSPHRAAERDRTAAAEDVNKAGVMRRRQLVDQPQQLAFSAHPGDEAFHPQPPLSWSNASSACSRPEMAD